MNLLYNGKQLEIVNDFNYLGVVLICIGNLKTSKTVPNRTFYIATFSEGFKIIDI
jgi:hypothetical protein